MNNSISNLNGLQIQIIFILLVVVVVSINGKLISEHDQELIEEIREQLLDNSGADEYLSDWLKKTSDGVLENWLRNADKDLDKAESQIMEHVNWRKVNNLDNAKDWKYSTKDELSMPFAITGHDEEGNSICYANYGSWDVRSLLAKGMPMSKIVKQAVRCWELAMQTPDPKTGKLPENFIHIADMDQFSISQVTSIRALSCSIQITHVYVTKFPFFGKQTICVKDPPYFGTMWAAIKTVLPAKFLAIISILGQDEKNWGPVLRQFVPQSAIPVQLGGDAKLNFVTHLTDN